MANNSTNTDKAAKKQHYLRKIGKTDKAEAVVIQLPIPEIPVKAEAVSEATGVSFEPEVSEPHFYVGHLQAIVQRTLSYQHYGEPTSLSYRSVGGDGSEPL